MGLNGQISFFLEDLDSSSFQTCPSQTIFRFERDRICIVEENSKVNQDESDGNIWKFIREKKSESLLPNIHICCAGMKLRVRSSPFMFFTAYK